MKVVVVGAGVVGIATAWYLTRYGHAVTVVERREGPALETSFANAGGICPGFAGPWAAPGMMGKALRWLFVKNAPLKIRPRLDPAQWEWLARFAVNCTPERFAANKSKMQLMAHYSMACLRELRAETGIEFDNSAHGVLHLFSSEQEMDLGRRSAGVLERFGIPHRLLDQRALLETEPALKRSRAGFQGALFLQDDETGDCNLFCRRLAELLVGLGCGFHFNTPVTGLRENGSQVTAVATPLGEIAADAVVLATGPFAAELLKPLSIRLALYPVKGYSMTCQIVDHAAAPKVGVMDEHTKIMVTRLGNRLRAAGIAELVGFDRSMDDDLTSGLRKRVMELFPDAARYDDAQFWCGFRAMTPQGSAEIGPTRIRNLFLNVGQGSNGWTQACGSGKLLADLVSGREPQIAA